MRASKRWFLSFQIFVSKPTLSLKMLTIKILEKSESTKQKQKKLTILFHRHYAKVRRPEYKRLEIVMIGLGWALLLQKDVKEKIGAIDGSVGLRSHEIPRRNKEIIRWKHYELDWTRRERGPDNATINQFHYLCLDGNDKQEIYGQKFGFASEQTILFHRSRLKPTCCSQQFAGTSWRLGSSEKLYIQRFQRNSWYYSNEM